MSFPDPVRIAVLCSLLGICGLAARMRVLAMLISAVGIVLLFIDVALRRDVVDEMWCDVSREPLTRITKASPMREPFEKPEPFEEKAEEKEVVAEEPPPVAPTPTTTPPVTEEDAYYYALGLVVQEYTNQPSYARYVRPKPVCDAALPTPAQDAQTRGRNTRVTPKITHGYYRSQRPLERR